jgi:hypothetical protein
LALAAVLALVGLAVWARRWRRSAHAKRLPPDQQVVHAWDHAQGALRRRGLARRTDETPDEYVGRVRSFERDGPRSLDADAVADLAHLVELACYTPQPCTPGQVATAQSLASTIVAENRRRSHRRRTARPVSTPHGSDL